MELVLLEMAFVSLPVVKELGALAVEHAVLPASFILFVATFPEQYPLSALHPVLKLALIPTAISPPEGSPAIPFPSLELPLIHIRLLSSPPVHTPALFFVKPKLAYIIISSSKVQLALSFQLAIDKLSVNDFVGVFEKAHALSMGAVDFCFTQINDLLVLVEFRVVESGVQSQHNRRRFLHHQQFFKFKLHVPQLLTNKTDLVIEVLQIMLSLLDHFLFRSFVYFQFSRHPTDKNVESFVHFLNGLELTLFELLHRILCEQV